MFQNEFIDVTTFDSIKPEYITVPNYGSMEYYKNAPYSITSSVGRREPLPIIAEEDETWPVFVEEPLWTLPWAVPTAPNPPRGFENLPTAAMFWE